MDTTSKKDQMEVLAEKWRAFKEEMDKHPKGCIRIVELDSQMNNYVVTVDLELFESHADYKVADARGFDIHVPDPNEPTKTIPNSH